MQDDQVTLWLDRLRTQDPSAAQQLWNRYSRQLAAVARRRFGELSRRAYDEEDAAISAFRSFCNGINDGRFVDLQDRDNIWRLLVTITARKVSARQRYEHREKRGGSARESAFVRVSESGEPQYPAELAENAEPTPEFAAELAEECEIAMSRLEDDGMRRILLLKLEGYNNSEIAEIMNCSRHRVQRKLVRIRIIISGEDSAD